MLYILVFILGLYVEWKWEIAKNIIESVKEHLNIK